MITFEGGNAEFNTRALLPAAEASCHAPSHEGETIVGTAGADTLEGGKGDDVIDGNQGADLMLGGKGDDTLIWDPGDGSDTLDGGAGFDTHLFNTSNAAETINLFDQGGHAILTRDVGGITMDIDNVERVVVGGGGGADRITLGDLGGTDLREVEVDLRATGGVGDGLADVVAVSGGADDERVLVSVAEGGVVTVNGLGPALSVTEAESLDRVAIDGGAGNDVAALDGGRTDDVIVLAGSHAQAGADGDPLDVTVNGADGHLSLLNVETVSIDAGAGDDQVSAGSLSITSGLVVDGGQGQDTILGGAGADTLEGGKGDDVIDGNQGADLMLGGKGDDTLIWDPGDGNDTLDGGAGFDTHLFNTSNAAETINLFGQGDHAILTRNVGSITMDIDNVERVIIGGAGGGDDRISVGNLSGTDVRQVEAQGGAGSDTLDASGFGGSADLTLSGGEGSDRFVFAAGHGDAVIVDFQAHRGGPEGDLVVLSGASDATFEAAIANHHIIQSGADVLISGLSGNVVTLHGVSLADLGAGDFLFG